EQASVPTERQARTGPPGSRERSKGFGGLIRNLGCIPDADRVVEVAECGAGQARAIHVESHAFDLPLVSADSHSFLAGGRLPKAHGTILAAGGQAPAIGAEGHGLDVPRVAVEHADGSTCRRVPKAHGSIPAGASEVLAVPAERHICDLASVTL